MEFGADPTTYFPVSDPYDEAYHVLQLSSREHVPISFSPLTIMQWRHSFTSQWLQNKGADDNQDTPWEQELKFVRMVR